MKTKTSFTFLYVAIILCNCARTPDYRGNYPNAITSLETIDVNGDIQHLLIRGKDADNPIILFLHGGPGMPMMYLAHKFQRKLEDHFTIVHWDQRGSGKSFKPDLNTEKINVRQYLDDAAAVVNHIKIKLNKERIILAGHSWGSYLGTLLITEYPSSFLAYISIGQVVDENKSLELQKEFLFAEAQNRDDKKATRELEKYGYAIHEKYLFKYGGELKNSTSYWPFIWSGLGSPEYSLKDVMKVAKGSSFCSANMKYNVISGSLMEERVFSFNIPVFYLVGVNDYTTPFGLITEYFEKIEAPQKELVWFKNSAHFPFYEEPDIFHDTLIKIRNKITLE